VEVGQAVPQRYFSNVLAALGRLQGLRWEPVSRKRSNA
jgi:hypothetical protein